jgi:hypothetical protein
MTTNMDNTRQYKNGFLRRYFQLVSHTVRSK